MKIVAFLPVKSTSERLASKNTKILFGKPLFLHSLEKLLACPFIDEVYLDSDSDEILDMYDHLPYKKFKRDPSLATNAVDGNALLYNECKDIGADICIQIAATAPFLSKETIKKAVEIVVANEHDSVVCGRKERMYLWAKNQPLYDIDKIPTSDNLGDLFAENMSLNVIRRDVVLKLKRRIGNKPYLLFVDKRESIDIDYEEDFIIAEAIMAQAAMTEKLRYDKIKQVVTSELLSDVLDRMGLPGRVANLKTNLPQTKIMGRAKTIRLKKIGKEPPEEIYDAVKYYDYINFNNILCVENEVRDSAYFGEINALLAIGRGCQGTIVDGATRDLKEVTALNYPVYYTEGKCQDLNKKAVLAHYDKPISIQGIQVQPDDLIFADHEGIIFFPKDKEEILETALENYIQEKKIIFDLASGREIGDRRF